MARGCEGGKAGGGMSSWKDYGAEEPWFCDDAAALTGLKYGWAIASSAVNRSWIQGQLPQGKQDIAG